MKKRCWLGATPKGLLVIQILTFGLRAAADDGVETSRMSGLTSSSSSKRRTQAHGDVKFEFTQYATSLPDEPKLNQSSLMEADLQAELKTASTRSRMDLEAGKFLDLNNSFFGVQELYTSAQFAGDHITAAVGRKIEFWSEVDQDWQLGLWEPKSNLVDSLRPVNQGLTGVFLRAEAGSWQLLAYGSPLFIPTVSPDITEKNGSLVADSRWYKTPSTSGDVLDRNTRFVYSLSVPELSKLVAKPGAGVRLRYGGSEPGFWASASYARKPVNSLFVKYDYNLYLRASGSQAEIDVSPAVAYHRLYGGDVGWLFPKGLISVSYLRDDPEMPDPVNDVNATGEPVTDWVQQRPGALKIAAAHAEASVQTPFFLDPVGFNLDYMKADEEPTHDYDASGVDRGALLPYRLNFSNAASFRTNFTTVIAARPLMTSFAYLRDFDQKGSVWTVIAKYAAARDWLVHAGVDVLGVDDDSVDNTDPHFLNQFRANDRVFGGLSYVF